MALELCLISAMLLDWLVGDPRSSFHPVRLIGGLCTFFESVYRSIISSPFMAGLLTVSSVLLSVTAPLYFFLDLLGALSIYLQTAFSVLVIYFSLALKDLVRHSMKVYTCLTPIERLPDARHAVGQIVGRDTSSLSAAGICRACVETVAENLVDGVTAPLFWAIILSFLAPLFHTTAVAMATVGIVLYKTINTMDSMFGYKNSAYIQFGTTAARLDDFVNYIPARLSAITVVMASLICGYNWRGSLMVLKRDRFNHPSPNSAHTEAAVAGALGIELGGNSYYTGVKIAKPTIGTKTNNISSGHILATNKIVILSSILFLVIVLIARKMVFGMV